MHAVCTNEIHPPSQSPSTFFPTRVYVYDVYGYLHMCGHMCVDACTCVCMHVES